MIETSLNGSTPDIAEENIQKLKQLFPEIFAEGKVDIEKLKQLLGEYVEDSNERYNFTWNGKGRALRLSQTPSTGTLRPCKEESKDWDTTQNLFIEGDNLEVLKLLQKSYYGKVKMIYIDPPYNTGKDFVYKDDFRDNLENYKSITGQVDGNGKAISTNTETNGRYHTDWLNMMYPRLRLARNLLKDDGVIFISIDDNEVHNLRKICDEVFGEDNFIAQLIWERAYSPKNDAKYISNSHDYVMMYAKSLNEFIIGRLPRTKEANARYSNPDNDPRGVWKPGDMSVKTYNAAYDYHITLPSGRIVEPPTGRCWRFSKNAYEEAVKDNRIWFGSNGDSVPQVKRFLSELKYDGMAPTSIMFYKDVGHSQEGAKEVTALLEAGVFEGPKPVRMLQRLLILANLEQNDVVLDFFSGSSTTAHAVMQLNAEDGSNRRFIMVQLPEPTDEKSEAYKAGYKNICEIGKERIRRAGEKIKAENKEKENIENLDVGFKVFKLDTSNIKKWQPDYDNLEQSLSDYVDNYVEGRTDLDVVYEIMLKYGLDLTYPVDEFIIAEKKVYSIGFGMLMICLDDEITTEVAKGILTKIKELSPESSRVVFKDNGFKTDSNKTNIKEILKSGGIEEFVTI